MNVRLKIPFGAGQSIEFSTRYCETKEQLGKMLVELGESLQRKRTPVPKCENCQDYIWGKFTDHVCIQQRTEQEVKDRLEKIFKPKAQ